MLSSWTRAPHGADVRAVAAAHLAGGRLDLALRILAAGVRDLGPAGLLDLARLYRRTGRWGQAVAIWERLDAPVTRGPGPPWPATMSIGPGTSTGRCH